MTNSRSIPSLDGLRAFSIALVIAGHSLAYLHGDASRFPFAELSELGKSGVDVFFVISGFLITSILVREYDREGSIHLGRFYFRRFFRIFPPFYVFLATIGILSLLGFVSQSPRELLIAGTYSWNYLKHGESWLLGHTWSLSLEEQFYLLWPPCLFFLGKRRSTHVACALIALSPLIRILSYFAVPAMRGNEGMMLHTRLDILMFGCAMALLWKEPRFHSLAGRLLQPGIFAFAVLYIVLLSPCLSVLLAAPYDWTVGYTIRGALISVVLLYVVKMPQSLPGTILNQAAIAHIGVISYSLYLWQQLFTGPSAFLPPLNLVAVLACAEASHWFVERPSFWLRDRIAAVFSQSKSQQTRPDLFDRPQSSAEPSAVAPPLHHHSVTR